METYKIEVEGVKTKKSMENLITEINNCEFCNNSAFALDLKEFSYDKKEKVGIGIVEIFHDKNIKIRSKITEMLNCEFCHSDIECISFNPA